MAWKRAKIMARSSINLTVYNMQIVGNRFTHYMSAQRLRTNPLKCGALIHNLRVANRIRLWMTMYQG